MDPEALMRMMQMGDQRGAPGERGSGRPRGGAPNGGATRATPDVGALLSSLGPDGMPDLDKIARASGMDPETMRGHAQRLWKHMDELAEKSPDEYRSFLEKQAANAGVDPNKAFGPAGGAGPTGTDPKASPRRRRRRRRDATVSAAHVAAAPDESRGSLLELLRPGWGGEPRRATRAHRGGQQDECTHEVRVTRGAGGVPVAVEVTCVMPIGVTSARNASTTVSARYVHVECAGVGKKACIALPVPVDPDDVSAVFKKKERRLTLRLTPASSD